MSSQEGIFKGDAMQKVTSVGLIIGAIMLAVFNILVPRPSDPLNVESSLIMMVDKFFLFQLSHLMLAFGIWGAMIGLAGVYRSINGRGSPWARIGFYGIVVGTAIFSITFALTSVEAKAATDWAASPTNERAIAYSIAVATVNVGTAAYIMSILLFWFAIVFLGIGMARSTVYPRWLGWPGIVLGVAMVATVGVPQYLTGEVQTSSMLLFVGLAILTILWFLAVGIWVARRAW